MAHNRLLKEIKRNVRFGSQADVTLLNFDVRMRCGVRVFDYFCSSGD